MTPIESTLPNTMALHCHASCLFVCPNIPATVDLLSGWQLSEKPWVIGGGSNVVLPSVINTPVLRIDSKELLLESLGQGRTRVIADAGMLWDDLVRQCVDNHLYGIENLSWIPGSVGAAPVQNIGAYGCELKDTLEYVEVFDWTLQSVVKLNTLDCEFAYRDSLFKRQPQRFVILRVSLILRSSGQFNLHYGELQTLQARDDLSLRKVRDQVIAIRQAKLPDPDEIPNTGSFFKNPVVSEALYLQLKSQFPEIIAYPAGEGMFKLAAGWLIDHAGWKGKQVGDMRVHEKQALVLTNTGDARQEDVRSIAQQIMSDVQERYGVELEIEPIFI